MSSVNFHKKPNPVGSTKNRKFLLSHIDIIDIHESNGNWTIKPPQSASNTNDITQPASSPLSKSNPNVRSVRHLAPPTQVEASNSPSRVQSTRTLPAKNPNHENTKENTVKVTFPKREKALRTVLPTSPNIRELRKNRELATTGTTFEGGSVTQEPRIEILDIALSPQIKRQMQGPKQDKILKLLHSYIPSMSSNKKGITLPPAAGMTSSMTSETTAQELQPSNSSHTRKASLQETAWESLPKPENPLFVLTEYGQHLTPYEKDEIQDFQDIYFISDCQHKNFVESPEEFDDERGDYVFMQGDHIKYQYEVIELLGRGSFGQVIKVFDHKHKEYVALKIIRSLKKFRTQAKVEIKLLDYMTENRGSDYNIMDIKDHFKFRRHTCLVFELLSINLYDFLKLNKFQGLHLSILRKIAIQVLYALKFLSRHRIIHCDLKPENILLKQPNRTGVRLIDFGSSCFENEKLYTYIQSRFYRAPEVILGLEYTTQIDMWSFGCLLCELYLGYPIFSGETEQDQLCAMMEVLGVPDFHFLAKSPRKKTFFEDDLKPKLVPNSKGRIRAPNTILLSSILNCEDKNFVDLVEHCLVYEPRKRFSPDDALNHAWILEDLPKELRTQHMKLISKIGPKPALVSFALNDKEVDQSQQEKSLLRRSSQPKVQEERIFSETAYLEVPGSTNNTTQQETLISPKQRGYSKMNKKENMRGIYSQGSLIASATINLNRSGNNTLRNNTSSSRDNQLTGHISPHSPKDGVSKMSTRNDLLSVKSSARSRYNEKLKRVTSSGKIAQKHYKEDDLIRDNSTKENNATETEEEYGINRKNLSKYKSWNFAKGSFEVKQEQSSEPKKASRPTSQKNVVPSINIRSPHRRKIV